MTLILDGRKIRDDVKKALTEKVSKLTPKPGLAIIQVGELAESSTYIGQKKLFGESIGAEVRHVAFPSDIPEEKLVSEIEKLNADKTLHGIIVQLPLPKNLDVDRVISAISPVKDVDGLHEANLKLLWENKPHGYTPATTKGVISLLDAYKIPINGKHVVVVGRSSLVGKPTALAFLNRDATVTICHKETVNPEEIMKKADILVVAVGVPKLVGARHVSEGQTVIDVGINVIEGKKKLEDEIPKRKLVGDVDFDVVKDIVGAITPVPGGAGPMTVASLFQNLLEAHARIEESKK